MAKTPDPIAAKMREVRIYRGWSLVEAEAKIGIDAMTIGSYERGDRQPPLHKLRQWVESFGLRLIVLSGQHDTVSVWTEYAVQYAVQYDGQQGLIDCNGPGEAAELSSRIPGSQVVSREVRATAWTRGDGDG